MHVAVLENQRCLVNLVGDIKLVTVKGVVCRLGFIVSDQQKSWEAFTVLFKWDKVGHRHHSTPRSKV